MTTRRLVVGISGASGFVYGHRLLQMLQPLDLEVHLVVSKSALLTMACETQLQAVGAERTGAPAAPQRGHRRQHRQRLVPHAGHDRRALLDEDPGRDRHRQRVSSLLSRAADVMLKERRRLVLMVRETPLSLVHLRNMVSVTEMGAIIAPPVPAFYARPKDLDDMVDHTLGRVLDLFDIDSPAVRRWEGTGSRAAA